MSAFVYSKFGSLHNLNSIDCFRVRHPNIVVADSSKSSEAIIIGTLDEGEHLWNFVERCIHRFDDPLERIAYRLDGWDGRDGDAWIETADVMRDPSSE